MQAAGSPDVLPEFSRASRPQKLATPTFQVPFCRTAVPDWFFSSGVPLTRMSYVTLAWVAEVTATCVTLAVASDARPEPAWVLITDANCEPSCSSAMRLLIGVLALKNASQFVVMAVVVALEPELADGVGELVAGADDVGAEVAGGDELEELGLLPPQAATVAASATAASVPASRETYR